MYTKVQNTIIKKRYPRQNMKRKSHPTLPPSTLSKKQQKRDAKKASKAQQHQQGKCAAEQLTTTTGIPTGAAGSSVYKRQIILPETCPFSDLEQRFFGPKDKEYPQLLQTSYAGFSVDAPEIYAEQGFHSQWEAVFADLDDRGIFQFDYTQPAGLNTKIARTFVTRCLVGEAGITYKYLGLRMFAYPWDDNSVEETAFATIGRLNEALITRSTALLSDLKKQKNKETGSCQYNLTLINRCFPKDSKEVRLKCEACFEQEKCTVSWHADSSLEHYSSIAVYHATKGGVQDESWRVALRVSPHAEGPTAGKRSKLAGAAEDSSLLPPPLAVPLPSKHLYYLLDDFNHHHQHSVLAGDTDRYASTHRVSRREGHTFQSIQQRCSSALQGSGYSAKQIRSEQLALNELEFEWIRQFFVQGQKHYDLHKWWQHKMQDLLLLFGQLEARTVVALQTLKDAAEGLSDEVLGVVGDVEIDRKERKKLAKRRKRVSTVEEKSFDELLSGLTDRHSKREGWLAREKDLAFLKVSADCRPMRIPLRFPSDAAPVTMVEDKSNGRARQAKLLEASESLKQWKIAFSQL